MESKDDPEKAGPKEEKQWLNPEVEKAFRLLMYRNLNTAFIHSNENSHYTGEAVGHPPDIMEKTLNYVLNGAEKNGKEFGFVNNVNKKDRMSLKEVFNKLDEKGINSEFCAKLGVMNIKFCENICKTTHAKFLKKPH